MNCRRAIVVLLFCFAVTMSIVHMEAMKVGYARRIAQLNQQMVELEYQQWAGQMQLARLCSPEQLRERSEKLALGTIAPAYAASAEQSGGELAGR